MRASSAVLVLTAALFARPLAAEPTGFDQGIDVSACLRQAKEAAREDAAPLAAGAAVPALPKPAFFGQSDNGAQALKHLLSLKQPLLNSLYGAQRAGRLPEGSSRGRATLFPGTMLGTLAQAARALLWQGKVFDLEQKVAVNKILGFRVLKAKIRYGESWYDGKPAIILDYSETSRLASMVRDELRQIAPEVYLGRVYLSTPFGRLHVLNIALDFRG